MSFSGVSCGEERAIASVPLQEFAEEQMKSRRFCQLTAGVRSWVIFFHVATHGITAQFKPVGAMNEAVGCGASINLRVGDNLKD